MKSKAQIGNRVGRVVIYVTKRFPIWNAAIRSAVQQNHFRLLMGIFVTSHSVAIQIHHIYIITLSLQTIYHPPIRSRLKRWGTVSHKRT